MLKAYCAPEQIKHVITLSTFRNTTKFSNDYGVQITHAPLLGLTTRAAIVLDEHNTVLHSELVAEIANDPDYKAAMAVL